MKKAIGCSQQSKCSYRTHKRHPETRKMTSFWAHFFYNMFLYCLTIIIIGITFLHWQDFSSGGWKKPRKQQPLQPICFIKHVCVLINRLRQLYNFSLVASSFLCARLWTNERVRLSMHQFGSSDNWLYQTMSNNS